MKSHSSLTFANRKMTYFSLDRSFYKFSLISKPWRAYWSLISYRALVKGTKTFKWNMFTEYKSMKHRSVWDCGLPFSGSNCGPDQHNSTGHSAQIKTSDNIGLRPVWKLERLSSLGYAEVSGFRLCPDFRLITRAKLMAWPSPWSGQIKNQEKECCILPK